jgi:hypothetical protein
VLCVLKPLLLLLPCFGCSARWHPPVRQISPSQKASNERKFYPVLADQHYTYLLRQLFEIRSGKRRNAKPGMVKMINGYSDTDIAAIADYMSRLKMPERPSIGRSRPTLNGMAHALLDNEQRALEHTSHVGEKEKDHGNRM